MSCAQPSVPTTEGAGVVTQAPGESTTHTGPQAQDSDAQPAEEAGPRVAGRGFGVMVGRVLDTIFVDGSAGEDGPAAVAAGVLGGSLRPDAGLSRSFGPGGP